MENNILNLTQHVSTLEQKAQGVFEPTEEDKKIIKDLLSFEELPTITDIFSRARKLALIADSYLSSHVMIGGAPFLMSILEFQLAFVGIIPCYAFSKRESAEEIMQDGSVVKKIVFRHLGFVEMD